VTLRRGHRGDVTLRQGWTAKSCVAMAVLVVSSVLPLATASAGTDKVTNGTYSGEVGPGYPMKFDVTSRSQVVDLVVSFDETCNGAPPDVAPKFHYKTLAISEGTFSGATSLEFGTTASDDLAIKGTFSGDKVKGAVTSRSFIKSLGTCTEVEPFTAELKK